MLGRTIKPRVFLEGVEIPAYKVTVQASIGAPAAAVIEIPPSDEFFERIEKDPKTGAFSQKPGVLPRTLVHVFYEDSEDPDGVARLLFEGEFVKFEYAKSVDRRSIKIVARDISNLLTTAYVRYYGDFFTPYAQLMTVYTGQGTVGKPTTEQIKIALEGIGGLSSEIISALKDDPAGVGVGAAFRDIAKKAASINTFFREFEARTKVTEKIVSLPDTKSSALLVASLLDSIAKQNMANLKESSTVWDLYTMLMSLVFYFPTPIPSAPFLPKAIMQDGSVGPFEVSKGKTLMSLLIKPYTWWTAPPTFNVIFPSQYKTFGFTRDFLAEPTRLLMSAFGVAESLNETALKTVTPSQYMFVAPAPLARKFEQEVSDTANGGKIRDLEKELLALRDKSRTTETSLLSATLTGEQEASIQRELVNLGNQIVSKEDELARAREDAKKEKAVTEIRPGEEFRRVKADLWNRSILTDADGVASASREDIKGIVYAFDYLTQTQVEVSRAKGIGPDALQNYLASVANYKLVIQQHRDRVAQVSMEFSPQLVCGFPALVVDPHRNFFGEVDSVTHILDAQDGGADTLAQISFVRTDEVEFTERARNAPGLTEFPRWINDRYLPGNIGDQVYKVLFPENRTDRSKPGIKAADSIMAYDRSSTRTQIQAAQEIRKLYYAAKDRERFALGFTRRNIASIDQVFGVLGAQRKGNMFVFSSFSDVRFQAALEYAQAAFKVATAARSDDPDELQARSTISKGVAVAPDAAPTKRSSDRVADAVSDGAKELEMRSASKSMKLEIVTRFTPPATIPPSGTVRFVRSSDGKTLTSTYEDSENILLDTVAIIEESGSKIKYSARGGYSAKLPDGSTGLLAAADVTSTFSSSDGQVTRDNAFLNGLQKVDPAVLSTLKKTR